MAKSLKELDIKRQYDPCRDGSSLLNDVYIPCLSNSIRYDRIAAFFSSEALKLYSAGLNQLIRNGGHARYIFSCKTNVSDMEKIVDAYKEKMNEMAEDMSSNDGDFRDDYNMANLSYLIKNNYVDIKIAFMVSDATSIMHIKTGLFEDAEGNKIYFAGSGNETKEGITSNAEIYMVFKNWEGEEQRVLDGEDLFDYLWNNTYSPAVVTIKPEGPLFDKLVSYDKGKVFNSQKEFDLFRYSDCVYIDINEDDSTILLSDLTKNKILKNPRGLKWIYRNEIKEIEEDVYSIKKLTLHDLRDTIPSEIKNRYGKDVEFSKEALDYIAERDQELDKRTKAAILIKNEEETQELSASYDYFKNIIRLQTNNGRELKEKQYRNAFHHYIMRSAMDFSVPGTGKTYISYGLFAYLSSKERENREVNHLVVFGPGSCFNAWIEECELLFGKNHYSIFDAREHHNDFDRAIVERRCDVYIINYEYIENAKRCNLISRYLIDDKTMIVFDEIHRIKSLGGIRANNMKKILSEATKKPVYKLALTGTPIPNSYVDLENYIELLYNDELNGYLSDFSENKLIQADSIQRVADEIQDSLYPLFTRTTKKDLNVPPANDNDLTTLAVKANPDEDLLYEYVYKSYDNPLVKFIRLIQASSNPRLLLTNINKEEIKSLYESDAYTEINLSALDEHKSLTYKNEIENLVKRIGLTSKAKKTIELIKDKTRDGKKIIVWCLFIDTINMIYEELTKLGIKAVTVTGQDPTGTDGLRNKKLNDFKYGNVRVLITNPNTLAESISLHMSCHDAIYYEYGFNLTYMLQSKDRIHRVGLPEGTQTNYYYAISESEQLNGSIDTRIYNRLNEKEQRMKGTVESNDLIFVPNENDLDDINYILNGMFNQ